MIASAMPAAMRPCPMLVAPDSSDKNFTKLRFKFSLLGAGLLHSPHVRGHRLSLHESSHLNLRFSKYVQIRSASRDAARIVPNSPTDPGPNLALASLPRSQNADSMAADLSCGKVG
jgi:hypothetical protein